MVAFAMDSNSWEKMKTLMVTILSRYKKLFTFIVSIIFLLMVFKRINYHDVLVTINSISLLGYIMGVLSFFVYLILKSKRWQMLLRYQGFNLSIRESFVLYNIGTFYGFITPGRIGDFGKVYHLPEGKRSKAIWSVIYDRVLDIMVLVILSIFAINFFRKIIIIDLTNIVKLFFYGGTFLFLVILIIGIIYGRHYKKDIQISSHDSSYVFVRLYALKERVHTGYHLVCMKKNGLIFVVTILFWIFLFGTYYEFAWLLGIILNIRTFVFVVSLVMLLSNLPISFSGIGIREYSFVLLLSVFGIDEQKAISLSVLVFSTYLLSMMLGIIFLLAKKYRGIKNYS